MDFVWHALSILASLTLPAVGWLGKSYLKLHNRLIRTETVLEIRDKDLELVKNNQARDDHRLTEAEGKIYQLQAYYQEMRQTAENRHKEITGKLEILPEIGATLKALERICETIVPRSELNAMFVAQDNRIEHRDERNDRFRDVSR